MAFLVAAVVVIVAGIGFMVLTQGNEVPPAAPALSVVMTSYEAWNNGDYDGYLATFTVEAAEEEAGDLTQILMNANQQIEPVEPCRVIETSPTGESTVQCLTTVRNDWNGPAGITDNGTETFVVNAENKISSRDDLTPDFSAYFKFNREFWLWFLMAYPDVYEEIKPIDAESLPGWQRDPSDMLIAVQYVDEFVAQSDDYPISP